MKKSVILFSGGIDSTTALYWAIHQRKNLTALTFDYGQRHKIEIHLARKLTQQMKVPHQVLYVNLQQIGGSSLTDPSLSLPPFQNQDKIKQSLPSTYVPFRNGIFLALAAGWAEVNKAKEIVCGFNVIDSPQYPDTRPPFVQAMETAINLGTGEAFDQSRFRIIVPFVNMKKSELIKEGLNMGADYSYSVSCYSGLEIPCMKCSACVFRQKAWAEVGMKDPLLSRLEKEGQI